VRAPRQSHRRVQGRGRRSPARARQLPLATELRRTTYSRSRRCFTDAEPIPSSWDRARGRRRSTAYRTTDVFFPPTPHAQQSRYDRTHDARLYVDDESAPNAIRSNKLSLNAPVRMRDPPAALAVRRRGHRRAIRLLRVVAEVCFHRARRTTPVSVQTLRTAYTASSGPPGFADPGQMLVHNHPSGRARQPSGHMQVAVAHPLRRNRGSHRKHKPPQTELYCRSSKFPSQAPGADRALAGERRPRPWTRRCDCREHARMRIVRSQRAMACAAIATLLHDGRRGVCSEAGHRRRQIAGLPSCRPPARLGPRNEQRAPRSVFDETRIQPAGSSFVGKDLRSCTRAQRAARARSHAQGWRN